MRLYKTYRYELIAALCGAAVMILELIGARMIAPYFGTSTYVWTAMIGVILGALSVGYWYGGKVADQRADDKGLMTIIVYAATAVLAAAVFQVSVLEYLSSASFDIRLQAILAATIIFGPAALLLGIVSPYVAKLRLSSITTAGQSIGRLYAAGTVGSIAGTFLAGYWLIGVFGNRTLSFLLVLVLVGVSFVALARTLLVWRVLLVVGSLVFVQFSPTDSAVAADIDSSYSRYQIVDKTFNGHPARLLMTDRFSIQSAQFIGQPNELAIEYIRRFYIALHVLSPERIVVIGGGVYTFPLAAATQNPDVHVDAVEIDERLNEVARDYFGFRDQENLSIHNVDGRKFLVDAARGAYDIVYLDAFSALVPPFHLVTKEASGVIKNALKSDGVVVANVIGAAKDDPYLQAMYATYKSQFRYVDVYPTAGAELDTLRRNFLFVMSNEKDTKEQLTPLLRADPITVRTGMVLTDDFAPIEQLIER